MAAPKFRSQVEVLSVVEKGRRQNWTDGETVRIVEERSRVTFSLLPESLRRVVIHDTVPLRSSTSLMSPPQGRRSDGPPGFRPETTC